MRIIGGSLKGRVIDLPPRYSARPTTDFAKEALFNILDNEYDFADLKVLDLFGGTGAISYEFASRGAARVYCVEMSRDNALFIRREAARLGLDAVVAVHQNVFDFLPICRERFDIVFADPPYALEGLETLPDKVFGLVPDGAPAGPAPEGYAPVGGILHPERYFILEHGSEHSFTGHPLFVKEKVYGRVHFSFFESK